MVVVGKGWWWEERCDVTVFEPRFTDLGIYQISITYYNYL